LATVLWLLLGNGSLAFAWQRFFGFCLATVLWLLLGNGSLAFAWQGYLTFARAMLGVSTNVSRETFSYTALLGLRGVLIVSRETSTTQA